MMVGTGFVRDITSSAPGFRVTSAWWLCFVGAEGAGTTPSHWLDRRGLEPSAAEATQPVPVFVTANLTATCDLLTATLKELLEAP